MLNLLRAFKWHFYYPCRHAASPATPDSLPRFPALLPMPASVSPPPVLRPANAVTGVTNPYPYYESPCLELGAVCKNSPFFCTKKTSAGSAGYRKRHYVKHSLFQGYVRAFLATGHLDRRHVFIGGFTVICSFPILNALRGGIWRDGLAGLVGVGVYIRHWASPCHDFLLPQATYLLCQPHHKFTIPAERIYIKSPCNSLFFLLCSYVFVKVAYRFLMLRCLGLVREAFMPFLAINRKELNL